VRRFIVRRFVNLIPLLLGISLLSFIAIQLSPGDFLAEVRENPVISQQTVDEMRHNFGLDQPLYVQYGKWLWRIVHLDFGYSFAFQVPVMWLIGSRLANTLILNIAALTIAWLVAIPIGIRAATRQYSATDNALSLVSYLGISTPTFFSGLVLLFLAFKTRWLPIGGMTSLDFETLPWYEQALDIARHLVIPAGVLGFLAAAGLMRQMRGTSSRYCATTTCGRLAPRAFPSGR